MNTFYSLPVDFGVLMRKEQAAKSTTRQSIRSYIYLILLTKRGEWRYDDDFQCLLWEKDFEQTDNLNHWLDDVKEDIRISVHRYETRLRIRNVDVEKDEIQEKNREDKVTRIRNRINIKIRGTIVSTDEDFEEEFLMFFGPITVV
jgi:phage baseplate assembly protein W